MRILHTVASYYPDQGGGAQEVVTQVSERLARRGHEVTVATSYSAVRTENQRNGVRVEPFRIWGVFGQSVLGVRGETDRYLELIRDGKFDVIMNYAAQTWHVDLTLPVLDQIKAKKVLAACGYSGLIGLRRLVYLRYFARLPRYLKNYDAVIYHSTNYQDKWFGDRHGIKHYAIIPNGIDPAEFAAPYYDFRQEYNISTKHMIVTVGNHFKNKGHSRILRAFDLLARDDVTLVIIGRDTAPWYSSCWPACRRAAHLSSHGRIRLLDNAPRRHVIGAYHAADLALFGSRIEAFPLVVLEAMASGTPFISFPGGNVAEMPGGIVVSSPAEMACASQSLLGNSAERSRLGRAGRQAQQSRYEWDTIVDQYESLYMRLTKS